MTDAGDDPTGDSALSRYAGDPAELAVLGSGRVASTGFRGSEKGRMLSESVGGVPRMTPMTGGRIDRGQPGIVSEEKSFLEEAWDVINNPLVSMLATGVTAAVTGGLSTLGKVSLGVNAARAVSRYRTTPRTALGPTPSTPQTLGGGGGDGGSRAILGSSVARL